MIRDRRRRGDAVPGFGHPLYPDGDPRTPPLLESMELLGLDQSLARVQAAAKFLAEGEPSEL